MYNFWAIDFENKFSVKCESLDRVTSQCGYPVITHNIVLTPIWTYRVFFGPLKSCLADVVIVIGNGCITWVLLCLTEALVVRAVMITSYKHVTGVNDKFMGTFIFLVNKGFSFGSHFGLCILGLFNHIFICFFDWLTLLADLLSNHKIYWSRFFLANYLKHPWAKDDLSFKIEEHDQTIWKPYCTPEI